MPKKTKKAKKKEKKAMPKKTKKAKKKKKKKKQTPKKTKPKPSAVASEERIPQPPSASLCLSQAHRSSRRRGHAAAASPS